MVLYTDVLRLRDICGGGVLEVPACMQARLRLRLGKFASRVLFFYLWMGATGLECCGGLAWDWVDDLRPGGMSLWETVRWRPMNLQVTGDDVG